VVKDKGFLKLPYSLVSPADLSRAIREVESLDNFLRQAKIRTPGNPVTPPKTSKTLEDLSEANDISLLDESQRSGLKETLQIMRKNPVKIHVSFASTPSVSFLQEVCKWFRQNVHQSALLETGLQPSIAAGCVIRTKNQVFDLSLRNRFALNREMLSKALEQADERQ
jgi:hypothetical protein